MPRRRLAPKKVPSSYVRTSRESRARVLGDASIGSWEPPRLDLKSFMTARKPLLEETSPDSSVTRSNLGRLDTAAVASARLWNGASLLRLTDSDDGYVDEKSFLRDIDKRIKLPRRNLYFSLSLHSRETVCFSAVYSRARVIRGEISWLLQRECAVKRRIKYSRVYGYLVRGIDQLRINPDKQYARCLLDIHSLDLRVSTKILPGGLRAWFLATKTQSWPKFPYPHALNVFLCVRGAKVALETVTANIVQEVKAPSRTRVSGNAVTWRFKPSFDDEVSFASHIIHLRDSRT